MIQMMILAASGWLLLVPPVKETNIINFEIDVKQPYTEWEQRGAFDTARECERAKESLEARLWNYLAQEKKSEREASKRDTEKIQEEDLPDGQQSQALAKLKSEVDASLRVVERAACEAYDFRGSSKECESKRQDLQVKLLRYMVQWDKEKQKKESRAETDKRWKETSKMIADLKRQMESDAHMFALGKARCIPSDMLTSQPKK